MHIVSRKEWGARAARSVERVPWKERSGVVIHHSAGPSSQHPTTIQAYHMDSRGWSDIGYNFLVSPEGKIFEGRGWTAQGAHCRHHNRETIGFCFIGDYRDGHDRLSLPAKAAGKELYIEACRRARRRLFLRGHADMQYASTACPGDQLLTWVAITKDTKITAKESDTEGVVRKLPTLKRGSSGMPVKILQALCNVAGVRPALSRDGIFGARTEHAVRALQASTHLTVDGVVGPATWAVLLGVE